MANKFKGNTTQKNTPAIIQMTPLLHVGDENIIPEEIRTLRAFEGENKTNCEDSPVLLKINKSPSLPFNRLFVGGHTNTGGNWPLPVPPLEENNDSSKRSKSIGNSALGMFRSVRRKRDKNYHTDIGNFHDFNLKARSMELKEIQKGTKLFNKRSILKKKFCKSF